MCFGEKEQERATGDGDDDVMIVVMGDMTPS